MKRGLKLICRASPAPAARGPNPGPDEEGIETLARYSQQYRHTLSPNPGPDEEGIETYCAPSEKTDDEKSEPRPR